MTRRVRILSVALGLALVPGACDSASAPAGDYTVSDVLGADLPPADLSRTWKYLYADVNADSLFRALLADAIDVEEAWEPLEDLCDDPIGPRFTVVLVAPDSRIAKHQFEPGNGIRACTRLVRRYIPVR